MFIQPHSSQTNLSEPLTRLSLTCPLLAKFRVCWPAF